MAGSKIFWPPTNMKTDWFFNMVLYVFMVKSAFEAAQKDAETEL